MSFNIISLKCFQSSRCIIKSVRIPSILLAIMLLDCLMGIANANAVSPDPLTNDDDAGLSKNDDGFGEGDIGLEGQGQGEGEGELNHYGFKRNWQSLQGAWGKRSLGGTGISAEIKDSDDDVYFAERKIPLPMLFGGSNGKKPILKYSLVFLKNSNGANILDQLLNAGNDASSMMETHSNDLNEKSEQYDSEYDAKDEFEKMIEKRGWKSMNVGWGKRRNPPQWNKFRGAWGKREPGWNNLKGMWGKRSSADWQKLHGSWGKRSFGTK